MKDKERIHRICLHIRKIMQYCQGTTYDTFSANDMLVEACVFNLSQIGEICHGVSDAFVAEHPNIPWNEMYGLRNRIVHDYQGVNLRLIWSIISEDLLPLLALLEPLECEPESLL